MRTLVNNIINEIQIGITHVTVVTGSFDCIISMPEYLMKIIRNEYVLRGLIDKCDKDDDVIDMYLLGCKVYPNYDNNIVIYIKDSPKLNIKKVIKL